MRPVVAIIQARMGSTRLPGKCLAPLGGRPLLAFMLDRVRRARTLDQIVVATTVEARDDELARIAAEQGVRVFRGSESDVLSRYHGAAVEAGARTVVRLTADCPLIDPAVIDLLVDDFASGGADVVANNAPPYDSRTYPDGMDVEVFARAALERAHAEATDPADREHVTRWLYFNGLRVREAHLDEDHGNVRITVDRPEDLRLVCAIVDDLLPERPDFTLEDVLGWLRERGALAS